MRDQSKDPEKENLLEGGGAEPVPAAAPVQVVQPAQLEMLDYEFLNGLRGWGAFAVYLFHFTEAFWKIEKHPEGQEKNLDPSWNAPTWLLIMRNSPLNIFIAGYCAVSVFFVLSGFVLPLRWFLKRQYSSIFGGIFRRYLRLMLPMFVCLSFYYLAAKLDWTTKKGTLNRVKPKSFLEFIEDSLIGVWFMNFDYAGLTWTLSVELLASYFIYVLALVPIHYKGRFWIYFFTLCFLYLPRITDAYGGSQYGFDSMYEVRLPYLYDKAVRMHLPTFAWGVIFCDIEAINYGGKRPLDVLRQLNIWAKIPLNFFLFSLFVLFGSVDIESLNNLRAEEMQTYSLTISFGYTIGFNICMLISALSIFLLALISPWTQWFLASPPFKFLGGVSYTLYLLHTLIIDWCQRELQDYFYSSLGWDYDLSAYYVFLIFTPVLLVISWLAEIGIDTPAKNLAQDLDISCRQEKPKPRKGQPPPTEETAWSFTIGHWQIWGLAAYLAFVFIITETYGAFNGNHDRMVAEGSRHPGGMQAI